MTVNRLITYLHTTLRLVNCLVLTTRLINSTALRQILLLARIGWLVLLAQGLMANSIFWADRLVHFVNTAAVFIYRLSKNLISVGFEIDSMCFRGYNRSDHVLLDVILLDVVLNHFLESLFI